MIFKKKTLDELVMSRYMFRRDLKGTKGKERERIKQKIAELTKQIERKT